MNTNLHQAQSHEMLRSWQSQRNDINHHKDFVLPMFIGNNDDAIEPIEAMPEVYRYGVNTALDYLDPLVMHYGLRSVLLFPVVTASDKDRLNAENSSDEDEEENDNTSNSSRFSTRSSSSSSTSQSTSDDNEQEAISQRLSSNGGKSKVTTVGQSSSQNPFLNHNEEEEDHLLESELGESVNEGLVGQSIPNSQTMNPTMKLTNAPAPPPRANETVSKISRSQDVRLIKGMALKDEFNPVLRLIPRLRAKFPKLLIICDVCLCAFTSTGHCCLFEDHNRLKSEDSTAGSKLANNVRQMSTPVSLNQFPISNKMTCQYLAMLSIEYAQRGCNVVAPSDMMDGRILTIREKLNENGLHHVSIMSYSAKFASAFYGPFRQATDNAPRFGDRRAYQLPPGSRALALKAVQRDIDQGADFVMVKPAGVYLDIVRDISRAHPEIPVAVYQVSGEYSMLKIAAKAGVIDLKQAVAETMTAYRRSGATIIISYFTPEILRQESQSSEN